MYAWLSVVEQFEIYCWLIYMFIRTLICGGKFNLIRKYISIDKWVCLRVFKFMCSDSLLISYRCLSLRIYTSTHTHTHTHTLIYIYIYIYIYIFTNLISIIYIYIYIFQVQQVLLSYSSTERYNQYFHIIFGVFSYK